VKKPSFVFFAVLVMVILSFNMSLADFKNKPKDFRGIKWGTNLKDLDDMILIEKGSGEAGVDKHKRKNDKMKIGQAYVSKIYYKFYQNRFFGVAIQFESVSNANKLRNTLFHLYGTGWEPVFPYPFGKEYEWVSKEVDVRFYWNKYNSTGRIIYTYNPIEEKRKKDKKEIRKRKLEEEWKKRDTEAQEADKDL